MPKGLMGSIPWARSSAAGGLQDESGVGSGRYTSRESLVVRYEGFVADGRRGSRAQSARPAVKARCGQEWRAYTQAYTTRLTPSYAARFMIEKDASRLEDAAQEVATLRTRSR
jgi:hypothetical protein